jgi:SET domain-containing protein
MSGYDLKVRNISGKGRGVIATREFKKGELIHVSPVILLREDEVSDTLDQYVFQFGDRYAVALGLGSLLNHSANPNAVITTRISRKEIAFWACRSILAGDEVVHSYGYNPIGYTGG